MTHSFRFLRSVRKPLFLLVCFLAASTYSIHTSAQEANSCSIDDSECTHTQCQSDMDGLIRHSLRIRKDLTGIFPQNTVASKFLNWMKGNANFSMYADFTLGDLMVPEFNPAQMIRDKMDGTKTTISAPKFEATPNFTIGGQIFDFPYQLLYLGVSGKPKAPNSGGGLKFTLKLVGVVVSLKKQDGVSAEPEKIGGDPNGAIKEQIADMGQKLKDFNLNAKQMIGTEPVIPIVTPLVAAINFGFTLGTGYAVTYGIGNDAFNFEGGVSGRYDTTNNYNATQNQNGENIMQHIGSSSSSSDIDPTPSYNVFGYSDQNLKDTYQKLKDFRGSYSGTINGRYANAGAAIERELEGYQAGLADRFLQGLDTDIVAELMDPDTLAEYASGDRGPPITFDIDQFKESIRSLPTQPGRIVNSYAEQIKGKLSDMKKALTSDIRVKIGGSVNASISLWVTVVLQLDLKIATVYGGIKGTLDVIRAGIGADVRANTGSQFVDLLFNYTATVLSGAIDLIYGINTPFKSWSGSKNLFSFPGQTYTKVIDPMARIDLRSPPGKPMVFLCINKNSDPRCYPKKVYVSEERQEQAASSIARIAGEQTLDPNARYAFFSDQTMICSSNDTSCEDELTTAAPQNLPADTTEENYPFFHRLMKQHPQILMTHQMDSDHKVVKYIIKDDSQNSSASAAPGIRAITGAELLYQTDNHKPNFENFKSTAIEEIENPSPDQPDQIRFNPPAKLLDFYPNVEMRFKNPNTGEIETLSSLVAPGTKGYTEGLGWTIPVTINNNPVPVRVDDLYYLGNNELLNLASSFKLGACFSQRITEGSQIDYKLTVGGTSPDPDLSGGSVLSSYMKLGSCFLKGTTENDLKSAAACHLRKALYQERCFPAEHSVYFVQLANMSAEDIINAFRSDYYTGNKIATLTVAQEIETINWKKMWYPNGWPSQGNPPETGIVRQTHDIWRGTALKIRFPLAIGQTSAQDFLFSFQNTESSRSDSDVVTTNLVRKNPDSNGESLPLCVSKTRLNHSYRNGCTGEKIPMDFSGGEIRTFNGNHLHYPAPEITNQYTPFSPTHLDLSAREGNFFQSILNHLYPNDYVYLMPHFSTPSFEFLSQVPDPYSGASSSGQMSQFDNSKYIGACSSFEQGRSVYNQGNPLTQFEFNSPICSHPKNDNSLILRSNDGNPYYSDLYPEDFMGSARVFDVNPVFSLTPPNFAASRIKGFTQLLNAPGNGSGEAGAPSGTTDPTALTKWRKLIENGETYDLTNFNANISSTIEAEKLAAINQLKDAFTHLWSQPGFLQHAANEILRCTTNTQGPRCPNLIPMPSFLAPGAKTQLCQLVASTDSKELLFKGSEAADSIGECVSQSSFSSPDALCKGSINPTPITPENGTPQTLSQFLDASPDIVIKLKARHIRTVGTVGDATQAGTANANTTVNEQEIGSCKKTSDGIFALTAGSDRGPASDASSYNQSCSLFAKLATAASEAKITDTMAQDEAISDLNACAELLTGVDTPGQALNSSELASFRVNTCANLQSSVLTNLIPKTFSDNTQNTVATPILEVRFKNSSNQIQTLPLGQCSINLNSVRSKLVYGGSCIVELEQGQTKVTLDQLFPTNPSGSILNAATVNDESQCDGLISTKYGSNVNLCSNVYKNARYASVKPLLASGLFNVSRVFKNQSINISSCPVSDPIQPAKIIDVAASGSSCTISRTLTLLGPSVTHLQITPTQKGYYNEATPGSGSNHVYTPAQCKDEVFDQLFGVVSPPLSSPPGLSFFCKAELDFLAGSPLQNPNPLQNPIPVENQRRKLTLTTSGESPTRTLDCLFVYHKARWLTEAEYNSEIAIDDLFGGQVRECSLGSEQLLPMLSDSESLRLQKNQHFIMGGSQKQLIRNSNSPIQMSQEDVTELCNTPISSAPGSPRVMDQLTPAADGDIHLFKGQADPVLGCPLQDAQGSMILTEIGTCPVEKCQMISSDGQILSEMGSGNTNLLLSFFRPTTLEQCKAELVKDIDPICTKVAARGEPLPDILYAKWGRAQIQIGACDPELYPITPIKCELTAVKPALGTDIGASRMTLATIGVKAGVTFNATGSFEVEAMTRQSPTEIACLDQLSVELESADYCGYARSETGFSDQDRFEIRYLVGAHEQRAKICLVKPTIEWPELDVRIPDPANPGEYIKNPDPGLEAVVTGPIDFMDSALAGAKAYRAVRFGCSGNCDQFNITREWAPYALIVDYDGSNEPPVTHYSMLPYSLLDQILSFIHQPWISPDYYQPQNLTQVKVMTPLKAKDLKDNRGIPDALYRVGVRVRYESLDQSVQTAWIDGYYPSAPPATVDPIPSPEPTPSPTGTPTVTPTTAPPDTVIESAQQVESCLAAIQAAGRTTDEIVSFEDWLILAGNLFAIDSGLAKEKLVSSYGEKLLTSRTISEWTRMTLQSGISLEPSASIQKNSEKTIEIHDHIDGIIPEEEP
jgi:hypothetical protein